MKQLKFNAHYSNGNAWSFCVREIESGLILPILRENWSISLIDGCIALDCEIMVNEIQSGGLLRVRIDDGKICARHGYIETLGPFELSDDGSRIICAIKLESFSGETRG